MKTYTPRPADIQRKWWVVDAEGKVLGRLASEVAQILRGKHKPLFTPHLDLGDYVIVVNADKIRVTGEKADQKAYFRHTGYMGGEKFTPFKDLLAKHPDRVIELAVKGMLPKNNLGRLMRRKLKVYAGPAHPHEAQQPEPLEI
jgi:large subunit ribosomal protein L13